MYRSWRLMFQAPPLRKRLSRPDAPEVVELDTSSMTIAWDVPPGILEVREKSGKRERERESE
jgi:hypothetical protein